MCEGEVAGSPAGREVSPGGRSPPQSPLPRSPTAAALPLFATSQAISNRKRLSVGNSSSKPVSEPYEGEWLRNDMVAPVRGRSSEPPLAPSTEPAAAGLQGCAAVMWAGRAAVTAGAARGRR